MRFPNVFLHINPSLVRQNGKGITVYKLNEVFDDALDGYKVDDKIFYRVNNEKMKEILKERTDYFKEISYKITRSPICDY